MNLELVEILQGIFSLIFTIITTVVGIRIALKYFESKNRDYLLIGLSWIGMALVWYPDSISFLTILFLNVPLNETAYFIIGLAFIPLGFVLWLITWTDLTYKEKQKIVLILASVFAIIYEIVFWYLIYTDLTLIGKFLGPFQVEYSIFVIISAIIILPIFLITSIIFSIKSIKSEKFEIKLRGIFFLIAVISFTIGALLDSSVLLTPITVVIIRLILISSSIEFYLAFNLPNWIKKHILD